jgi:dolichyl-phosphate-mannose-protein mannosyltransferase
MTSANLEQYSKYSSLALKYTSGSVTSPSIAATPEPLAQEPQVPVVPDAEQKPLGKAQPKEEAAEAAGISGAPAPPKEAQTIRREEKVEYRDQNGNLLNDEQVAALEGKVEFKTKYETRMRVVDDNGNELPEPEGGWPEDVAGVAPPHPDVEGVDKETVQAEEAVPPPQDVPASRDGEKEAEQSKPKPASEGQDATVHEEL